MRRDRTGQVVAFIDERPCSLVALQRAIPLVPHGRLLSVVLLAPRMPVRIAMMWCNGVALPDTRETTVQRSFSAAAAILAPTGLPWDFAVRDYGLLAQTLAAPGDDAPTMTIAARHRAGPFHLPFRRGRVEQYARTAYSATPPLVVTCDHGAGSYILTT